MEQKIFVTYKTPADLRNNLQNPVKALLNFAKLCKISQEVRNLIWPGVFWEYTRTTSATMISLYIACYV